MRTWMSRHRLAALLDSPTLAVTRWEMRALMRGWRAPVALLACSLLAAVVGVAFLQAQFGDGSSGNPMEFYIRVAQQFFAVIVWLEAGLLFVLMPAFTLGMMRREFDQRTLDNLLLTHLAGREIALGKLLAAVSLYAVILLGVLPVLALTFVLGGVSPWEVLWSQVLLLAMAAVLGAVGLHSAAEPRHVAAVILRTYLTILTLLAFASVLVIGFVFAWINARIQPIMRRPKPRPFDNTWKLLIVLLLVFASFGMMVATIPVLLLSHPAVILFLLLDSQGYGSDLITFLGPFWWLLPPLHAAVLFSGTRHLLDITGARIRPSIIYVPRTGLAGNVRISERNEDKW